MLPSKQLVNQQGFTLIEVMVALAILAVVAVAASQASRAYLNSVETIKQRTQAYFIATNMLADQRIEAKSLTGVDTQQLSLGERQWQVTITAKAASFDGMKLVSVNVAPIDNGQVKNSVVTVEGVFSDIRNDPINNPLNDTAGQP